MAPTNSPNFSVIDIASSIDMIDSIISPIPNTDAVNATNPAVSTPNATDPANKAIDNIGENTAMAPSRATNPVNLIIDQAKLLVAATKAFIFSTIEIVSSNPPVPPKADPIATIAPVNARTPGVSIANPTAPANKNGATKIELSARAPSKVAIPANLVIDQAKLLVASIKADIFSTVETTVSKPAIASMPFPIA